MLNKESYERNLNKTNFEKMLETVSTTMLVTPKPIFQVVRSSIQIMLNPGIVRCIHLSLKVKASYLRIYLQCRDQSITQRVDIHTITLLFIHRICSRYIENITISSKNDSINIIFHWKSVGISIQQVSAANDSINRSAAANPAYNLYATAL